MTLKIRGSGLEYQVTESDEVLYRSTCWRYERDFPSQVEGVVSGSPKGAGISPVCRSVATRRLQEVRWGSLETQMGEMPVRVNMLFESRLCGENIAGWSETCVRTCMKSSSDDKGVCVAWEEPETPTTFPEDGFAEIRFSPPANDSVFSAMLCAKSSISGS